MLDEDFALRLELYQLPVLVGIVAIVIFSTAERLIHLMGLRQKKAREKEHLSFYFCVLSWYAAVMFSAADALVLQWTTISPSIAWIGYLGVPFLAAGIPIRIIARITLGRQFSGHVQTTDGHKLIDKGIYGYVRHPAYLGFLCLLFGFPISFGSIGGFAIAVALGVPALIYRIRIEEAALVRWFGEEYQQYQERTDRLVPSVW